MNSHVTVGTVPDGHGGDIVVCLHPDGSVDLYRRDGGRGDVAIPAASLGPLRELLDRAAMPGQVT